MLVLHIIVTSCWSNGNVTDLLANHVLFTIMFTGFILDYRLGSGKSKVLVDQALIINCASCCDSVAVADRDLERSGSNPTIISYNASLVKTNNATIDLGYSYVANIFLLF
jgi:hypothetical protein